jgi:hypothetical protein
MKRAVATLASTLTLLSLSAPAFASPNFSTRHHQPRADQREVKRATLATYRGRTNRAYTRARYNALVQRMTPSLLAVTGPMDETNDAKAFSRPGTREIDNWTFEFPEFGGTNCSSQSRRCGEENH